jgi:transposase
VHSRYERTLDDAAIGGMPTLIRLRVRRFFCENSGCSVRTFAEQVDGLTAPYARRSPLLRGMLEAIGLALAGRAGARLAAVLGLPSSRSTMLRLIRAIPDPEVGTVTALGVDDFALTRRHVYGTVLIDMDTHRPVDLLPDRHADTFAQWLHAHPGTQVICRDRAGAYADGAATGAPQARQVADRWHLWHNLAEHVEKTIARHQKCLAAPNDSPAEPPTPPQQQTTLSKSRLLERTRQRHEAVRALRARGFTITAITHELGLARGTVRRFVRADTVDSLLAVARDGRPSILDDFKQYLHDRWNEGVRSAAQLCAQIRTQGYQGSYVTVRNYLRPLRSLGLAPPPALGPPKIRQVAAWMLRHPDNRNAAEQVRLKQVLANCSHLGATAGHVAGFAEIMTSRRGEQLDKWIEQVESDDLPHLHSFAAGLKRDYSAVINGLTLPHSSGAVEGNVNRIKMIKRQMYGRAKFDLLRKRILLQT